MSATEQRQHLSRVAASISGHVLAFLRSLPPPREFHLNQLTAYVIANAGGTGDSASRILRMLKADRVIHYRCVNRAQSHYQLVAIEGERRNEQLRLVP